MSYLTKAQLIEKLNFLPDNVEFLIDHSSDGDGDIINIYAYPDAEEKFFENSALLKVLDDPYSRREIFERMTEEELFKWS